MNIEEDHEVPLILGRPFMKTTRIMIDADNGQMKVRVQDENVTFNLLDTMKHPEGKGVFFQIDATKKSIQEVKKLAT